MNSYYRLTCLVVAAVLSLPAVSAAPSRSSLSESRGYQTCRAQAEQVADMLHLYSDYYIYQKEDTRLYYMNGYALLDDGSKAVKIACLTSASGHRLETFSLTPGVYVGRLPEQPAVASVE